MKFAYILKQNVHRHNRMLWFGIKIKENDGFAKELELSQCSIQSCKVILLIKLTEKII